MRIYRDRDGDVCVEPGIHAGDAAMSYLLVADMLWVGDNFIHIRRII